MISRHITCKFRRPNTGVYSLTLKVIYMAGLPLEALVDSMMPTSYHCRRSSGSTSSAQETALTRNLFRMEDVPRT